MIYYETNEEHQGLMSLLDVALKTNGLQAFDAVAKYLATIKPMVKKEDVVSNGRPTPEKMEQHEGVPCKG